MSLGERSAGVVSCSHHVRVGRLAQPLPDPRGEHLYSCVTLMSRMNAWAVWVNRLTSCTALCNWLDKAAL
jgi:hypothetical protein